MNKERKILVVHGPNLNMLGKREPSFYGHATLEDIDRDIKETARACDMVAETFQSNYEGAIVEKIHEAVRNDYDGLIINPGAYTHTSIAIRDALLLLDLPIIEVHLSNIYQRESFRHRSYVADVAVARIAGLKKEGYMLAVRAIADMIQKKLTD